MWRNNIVQQLFNKETLKCKPINQRIKIDNYLYVIDILSMELLYTVIIHKKHTGSLKKLSLPLYVFVGIIYSKSGMRIYKLVESNYVHKLFPRVYSLYGGENQMIIVSLK